MLAIRKLNNNAVLCKDSKDNIIVALGKGVGFGEIPREIPLSQIDQTFYNLDAQYYQALSELPFEILGFSSRIVQIAKNELPYELTPGIVVTLADHISFALERARKNIYIQMPLAYDIEQMYPSEYKIGRNALKKIYSEFKVKLPENEAIGIAMSILNARVETAQKKDVLTKQKTDEMIEKITQIVEDRFHFIVDRQSFNFSRYATHLQYLFSRIFTNKTLQSDNETLYTNMKNEFPQISDCVNDISLYINEQCNITLSNEEKLYLMLHVNRICTKEGL